MRRTLSILFCSIILTINASAQLSKNPDKFLGNITTYGHVNPSGLDYSSLWNQITPENETKWSSCEGTQGSYYFNKEAYNYANSHNFPFKFHTLVWGSQFPNWVKSLTPAQRYTAIEQWMDRVKYEYPDLKMIDVVNEAIQGHQQDTHYISEALGGGGRTGYDWIIKAFEMAYERWPDAILIYNDFNTFQWNTDQFIDLVRTLRDAGAPIDAYGCQSHDMLNQQGTDTATTFRSSMDKIHEALMMPMFSTEYDVGTNDDALQLKAYKAQIPYMWEKDYCAGITLWGYVYGATWTGREEDGTKGNSGIIRSSGNGYTDRPAMQWLREYMESPQAINAKSPFPSSKKPISLYIKPASTTITINDTLPITVRATLHDTIRTVNGDKDTIRIDSIKLYVKGVLDTILTKAPYVAKYVPTTTGKHDLKAVVYTNKGNTYERLGSFRAHNPRSVYNNDTIKLPGTLQVENFDKGDDGVTYHDNDANNQGDANFRTGEGVDIYNGNGGKVIGYTNSEEWLEYTVIITQDGYYDYEAVVSSGNNGTGFRLSISEDNGLTDITGNISVPKTGSDWNTYKSVYGRTLVPLKAGINTIRLTITGAYCNVDKITFKHVEVDKTLNLKIAASPSPVTVEATTKLSFTPINSEREKAIKNIKVFIDGMLMATLNTQPFQYNYTPSAKGTNTITAIATDTLDYESEIASLSLKVNNKRSTFGSSPISIPGVIQAENFDKGGEGLTFHDKDSEDEGKTGYRTDNEGVDIVEGNGGHAIGYTSEAGEWLEYTVNVTTAGTYNYTATVSSGSDNTGFRIGLMKNGAETTLANVSVPNGGNWDTYTTRSGRIGVTLEKGQQIIRITITGPYCNIDKIQLSLVSSVKYVTPDDVKANGTRYNLGGAIVGDDYKGIVIIDGKKVLQK